jgi:tRNA A-37 threonylcarbamoyl transferase component Bud32
MKHVFIKTNVQYNEYFIHYHCYSLLEELKKNKDTYINISIPKIISYHEEKKILTMQKVHGDNISNIYGEEFENVPPNIINIIRQCLYLFDQYLIDYIDITGYNFMLDKNDNLWIIDFEHAKYRKKNEKNDDFLYLFINGKNSWNPEFK